MSKPLSNAELTVPQRIVAGFLIVGLALVGFGIASDATQWVKTGTVSGFADKNPWMMAGGAICIVAVLIGLIARLPSKDRTPLPWREAILEALKAIPALVVIALIVHRIIDDRLDPNSLTTMVLAMLGLQVFKNRLPRLRAPGKQKSTSAP